MAHFKKSLKFLSHVIVFKLNWAYTKDIFFMRCILPDKKFGKISWGKIH